MGTDEYKAAVHTTRQLHWHVPLKQDPSRKYQAAMPDQKPKQLLLDGAKHADPIKILGKKDERFRSMTTKEKNEKACIKTK
jgi:hypothetical protein